MNAAPRSSRVVMNRIEESAIASITWRFSSPGSPKMYSTPSFSRHSTSRRATVCAPCAASISRSGYPRRRALRSADGVPRCGEASADGAPFRPGAGPSRRHRPHHRHRATRVRRQASRKGSSSSCSTPPETVAEFWETTRDPEFGWEAETVAHGPTVLILPLPDAHTLPRALRAARQDRVRDGRGGELARPLLGDRRGDGLDADVARRRGRRARRMVLRHHLRGARAPGSVRRPGPPPTDRIIGLGLRAEDEEPSGSWTKHRRRPLEEQIHRDGW